MTKQEMIIKFRQFDFNRVIMIVSVLLLVVLMWENYDKARKIKVAQQLNNSLYDTITVWKTREGLSRASSVVIEGGNIEAFLERKSKDSTIVRLQALVKENKNRIKKQGSVTIVSTEIKIDTTTKTAVNNNTKEVSTGDSPIYTSKLNMGKWVVGEIIASRDSTVTKLVIKEEMDIVIGREKTGFLGLGKGKTFTEATLHNPYSEFKVVKTYQTELPRDKKFHIGPTLMYGLGSDFKFGAYIGIGITRDFINF